MTVLGRALLCILAVIHTGIPHAEGGPVPNGDGRSNTGTTNVSNTDDTPRRIIVCGRFGLGPIEIEIPENGPSNKSYRGHFPWIAALGYYYTLPVYPNESLHQNMSNVSPEDLNEQQHSFVAHFDRIYSSDSPHPNASTVYWKCGGSIVTPFHVITAAQCVVNTGGYVLSVVRLGDIDLDDTVEDNATAADYEVGSWIAHPGYRRFPKVNDIAIVTLKNEVIFKQNVRPICLPTLDMFRTYNFAGYYADITGWGTTAYGGPKPTHLRNGRVMILDQQECQEKYRLVKGTVIDNRVVCAGGNNGVDACQGDAGGPLSLLHYEGNTFSRITETATFYLYGIVAYGYRCGESDFPGVYTRVSEYMEWILNNIGFQRKL